MAMVVGSRAGGIPMGNWDVCGGDLQFKSPHSYIGTRPKRQTQT